MELIFPSVDPNKCLKTYGKADRTSLKPRENPKPVVLQLPTLPTTSENELEKSDQLTTKNAIEFLLKGTLKSKVCRYCLNVATQLSHLDQILHVAGKGAFYKVTIKDMIASFHPFKVSDDPNFPNKICEKCLNHAISCYLFTQQCDLSERALQNCFDDIYDKVCKLDPMDGPRKRGRLKRNPNYNVIRTEHEKVTDYAEPVINIVNTVSEVLTEQTPISELECLKCCEILPNLESLMNHTTKHPKSMWYNCRLCGTSFAKQYHLKKHFNLKHSTKPPKNMGTFTYDCKKCGLVYEKCTDYVHHLEKHKFKSVMEHLVERKMDKLCALCFNKASEMVPLDRTLCVYGACPEQTGDKSLHAILAYILPEMTLESYTSTKICEKCFNNALTSYIFVTHSHFTRNRLATCVTSMLDKLNTLTEIKNNICVEIATNAIINVEYNETVSENGDNEKNLNVEVLEDEFRVESENESETEIITSIREEPLEDNMNKTHKTLLNGLKYANDVCSEFLTFKNKPKQKRRKFTCPICQKHFVSDYFLKRHCVKHIPRRSDCNMCDLNFKSKFDLYEHRKMFHMSGEHGETAYLSCETCGRCIKKEKFEHHMEHHRNPLCQICDIKFQSQSTYIFHMYRHMKNSAVLMKTKQNCSFCEKECSNDNEFSLHVNKVHLQMKPYSCDMCERQFYTEYNLKCHRKVHSVYGKEQCEFCCKILYSRKKLVRHISKHIGDTPKRCEMCNQSFCSQLKLKKHLAACHGGRLCCQYCKIMFVTKKELECHINKAHNMF